MRSSISKTVLVVVALVFLPAAAVHARLNIFACEPEWAELAKELAGDKAKVFSATLGTQDPHYIQARPSLIARLRSADLAVCTGAGLEEGWMPLLQRKARNSKVITGNLGYFEATQQVHLLEKPVVLDRAAGHMHGAGNPHIQLDPRRLAVVAERLSSRLQEIDPANKAHYEVRSKDFLSRWKKAMSKWEQQAKSLNGAEVIVHHAEWIYLWDWLGIKRVAALEPKPGVPPTLDHMAGLQNQSADMVIVSTLNNPKPAKWFNDKTGLPVVELPLTVGAMDGTGSLFALFDVIIKKLTNQINNK